MTWRSQFARAVALGALLAPWNTAIPAELTENCTVSVLNRTAAVKSDGSWSLPNVPATFGNVRARATCVATAMGNCNDLGMLMGTA